MVLNEQYSLHRNNTLLSVRKCDWEKTQIRAKIEYMSVQIQSLPDFRLFQ